MPARKVPLVTGELYHIINRGNASVPIFKTKRDYHRFIETFLYYQNHDLSMRYAKLFTLSLKERESLLNKLKEKRRFWVEIIAYCLMPNHYHFILKQVDDKGISNFIRLLGSSYSHYFNIKNKRKGSLFEGRFKAIRIETDSQLLHLSRYVHLNPYSSFLVKSLDELTKYAFSSLPEYLGQVKIEICQKEIVLSSFSNLESYKQFVFDRADYQRSLEEIKHQLLED